MFGEIDRQSVENFSVYDSKAYPGTSFTYSRLTLTPEFVHKIAQENPESILAKTEPTMLNDTPAENDVSVLFGYFLLPPEGHALDVIDMATDRFMRKIAKVAHTMRDGKIPPNVEIYLLGSTTGFGGRLTGAFTEAVKSRGLMLLVKFMENS